MTIPKKQLPSEKLMLHPRNKHRGRYDLEQLCMSCPELAPHVVTNQYNDLSIDFFNPAAVKMLNKALLQQYYNIVHWDIPSHYLCPPIPGRADYIHNLADLLSSSNEGTIPTGRKIKCLDIGVGANCIYPLIGNHEYAWTFVGADIDATAVNSATQIIQLNPQLNHAIEIRLQADPDSFFKNIIQKKEFFDITLCNPPFHASEAQAHSGTQRKLKNLTGKSHSRPILNFSGQKNELFCEGGERGFLLKMINESKDFSRSCLWFSTLVSKKENLKAIYIALEKLHTKHIKTFRMAQGNKVTRCVAWTFLNKEQQTEWVTQKWRQ